MTDLYFAEPQWIHGLWAVLAFLLIMIWLERRSGGDLSQFVSKVLQPRLVRSASYSRRMIRVLFLSLSGVFLVISLMRPQWGLQFVSTPKVGAEIMICLDVSKSMLAEDVAPNRLGRAKADLGDLLNYLNGDQVGLIAFAGRATVLSPLTPDFGFLRLVLDGAGAHSVTRGGTRLEEPIRKAIEGFGDTADVSRSILLITDGEDHDSFPLEAAKAAAERGIRILSIGFGDENGSEIVMTDPKTGARQVLRDSDGFVVRSRLDGDMLREISLITEGAYIPAGTGVLDLHSIYDAHIAGLTRGKLDGQGHTVRNDAFQFTLMLALLMLLAAVVSTVGGAPAGGLKNRNSGNGNPYFVSMVFILSLVCSVLLSPSLSAIENEEVNDPFSEESKINNSGEQNVEGVPSVEPDKESSDLDEESVDPRLMYNEGLSEFDLGQWDAAEKIFQKARSLAATDGDLRFSATYNLAWVAVKRADSLLEAEPKKALASLYVAADWFREAIALRSDGDARHNLEVVLSRALILADDINKQEPGDLLKQVNKTIDSQRAFLNILRDGVNLKVAATESNATESVRRNMRSMATQQLEVLSESQQLTEFAGREMDVLKGKGEEEQTAEDKMKLSQLEGLLGYLHTSQEKMGQARRRMRTLQVERAYRRAAAGLTELKKGRDLLLDPVTRIDVLLTDGMELMRLTGVRVSAEQGGLEMQVKNPIPAWLTDEFLTESQQSLDERTETLHQGLNAGLEHAESQSNSNERMQGSAEDPEQAKLIAKLRVAVPFLGQARQEFGNAVMELESARLYSALEMQKQGITYLSDARERFLDLRQLIELVYQDELQIRGFVTGDEATQASEIVEYLPLTAEMQDKNLQRVPRIGEMVASKIGEILLAKDSAQQGESKEEEGKQDEKEQEAEGELTLEQLESEEKRYQQADELQLQIQKSFRVARNDIQTAGMSSAGDQEATLNQAQISVNTATENVENLRRLFFSVVEHLKEATRNQIELSDETNDIVTLSETSSVEVTTSKMGPINSEQQRLSITSGAIADALAKQAESMAADASSAPTGNTQSPDPEQMQEMIEKYKQASGLVFEAQSEMNAAVEIMNIDVTIASQEELPKIAPKQAVATEHLLQAIALLEPPKQDPDEQQDQDKQDQQQDHQEDQEQQGEQEPQGQGDKESQEKPQERGDYEQMLQGVRDREKQRREEQEKAQQHGYEPVEKDW
ncbi:MAG: VWA domain-containing protein [Pseudomonadales bacterium]|nr:VWA domain-containing protein [Pseudomonadales bacterium]